MMDLMIEGTRYELMAFDSKADIVLMFAYILGTPYFVGSGIHKDHNGKMKFDIKRYLADEKEAWDLFRNEVLFKG